MSKIDYSQIIIDTINKLFSSMFTSIDNSLYSILDNIVFIDSSILNDSFFNKVFGSTTQTGLITIANSIMIGLALYYCSRLLISMYTINRLESPRQFIFKLIIITILINYSPFLCQQLIDINSFISDAIREVGLNIIKINISFSSLISQINTFIY